MVKAAARPWPGKQVVGVGYSSYNVVPFRSGNYRYHHVSGYYRYHDVSGHYHYDQVSGYYRDDHVSGY